MDHFLWIQIFCNLQSDVLVTISTWKTGRPTFPSIWQREILSSSCMVHRLSEEQFFDFRAGTTNLDLVGRSLVAWNIVLDFFLFLRPNPRHKIEWTWRLIRKVLKAQKVAVEDLVYRGLVPFRHDSLARVSKGSFQMVESCIQFHAVTSNILHYLWWWNHTKAACWLP